jgi:hypothetical protein
MEKSMSEDSNKSEQKSEEKRESDKSVEHETDDQSSLPLYLRNKSEGNRGNTQDEKDASAE